MAIKEFTIYKLHFTSPLHISNNREDYGVSLKTYSSDSFYAAITSTLSKLGIDIPVDGYLGCVISSLFPYYQESTDSVATFFFPKPFSFSFELSDLNSVKRIKKVEWIDKTYLELIINGKDVSSDSLTNDIQGAYLTGNKIETDFIHSDVCERVAVDKNHGDSTPFYIDRLFFRNNSGLFFMAEGDTSLLDKALPLLSLEGIGTDRNVGYGLFSFEKKSIKISLPDKADYGLSLSVFIPEDSEQLKTLVNNNSCYELQKRGGWISTAPYNSLRKNTIYALMPGSVLYGTGAICGKIVDLAPQGLIKHPVWRCGRSLFIPIIN